MEIIKKEFCINHEIPWTQRRLLKDVRTFFICAFNKQDWNCVEKLLDLFPEQLEQEFYELSWAIFTNMVRCDTHLLRIIVARFAVSSNVYHRLRGMEIIINMFIYKDCQSIRHLNRFYQSCKEAVDSLLGEKHQYYYNVFSEIFVNNNLDGNIKRLYDICSSSQNMRQCLCRFVTMCIIFDRCDVLENIYQTMKMVDVSPPAHHVLFVRRSACVIQRAWRKHKLSAMKHGIARVCYKLDLKDNIGYVIYKHSGLENSYKKI